MSPNLKKILWVTADCFVDHDISIVPKMSEYMMLHWVILFPKEGRRFSEDAFAKIKTKYKGIKISYIYSNYRRRYPQNILFFNKIYCIYKEGNYDVVHMDIGVDDPWSLPLFYRLPSQKTIVVVHQGAPHEGMKNRWLCNFIRRILFARVRFVKMFSDSQAVLFSSIFPKIKVFRFKLPLIDFGDPTNTRPSGELVRFLSFGTINYTKNIDLLIEAACLLYERGVRNFTVSINGMCKDWSWYESRIKYPEIFDNQIRLIDNAEIPNLFNGAHYLVQPYRVVSQSGPTKIAFQYNLPVLTSNLPGFMDEVVEGVNGYTFEKGNMVDLADKMETLIKNHKRNYRLLLESECKNTEKHYSNEVLVKQYIEMFNEII